jgi:hypothetical protein
MEQDNYNYEKRFIMKKAIHLFIALVIMFALSIPAYAEMTEAGLFEVTIKVKDRGGLKKGKNIINLTIKDSDGKAVEGAQVEIIPFMPTMKHGTPWFSKVNDLGGGKYRTNIPITMGGIWEFRVSVKHGDKTDRVVFLFRDVKDDKGKKKPGGGMDGM